MFSKVRKSVVRFFRTTAADGKQYEVTHYNLDMVLALGYLLTWNCTHIANAHTRPKIEATCRALGYEPPIICTPQELTEEV